MNAGQDWGADGSQSNPMDAHRNGQLLEASLEQQLTARHYISFRSRTNSRPLDFFFSPSISSSLYPNLPILLLCFVHYSLLTNSLLPLLSPLTNLLLHT